MEYQKIPFDIKSESYQYSIDKGKSDESSASDNSPFPPFINNLSLNSPDNYFTPEQIMALVAGKNEEGKIQNESEMININEESKDSSSVNDYSINSFLNQNKIKKIFEVSMNGQEKEKINKQKKDERINNKIHFNVTKFDKNSQLTNIENKSTDLSANDEITFLKRHRNKSKRKRRDNKDNIRKKIKTGFFNRYLYTKINKILIKNNSKIKFPKFPQKFCSAISREANMKLLNSTLLEILGAKEQYSKKELKNFAHNKEILGKKEIQENEELQEILNKTYRELFEVYINSKEFNVDEINRLKNKKNGTLYIKFYKYLAKTLIEFYLSLCYQNGIYYLDKNPIMNIIF